jgi:hypothetical protein
LYAPDYDQGLCLKAFVGDISQSPVEKHKGNNDIYDIYGSEGLQMQAYQKVQQRCYESHEKREPVGNPSKEGDIRLDLQKFHDLACIGKKRDQQDMKNVGDKNKIFYPRIGGHNRMLGGKNKGEQHQLREKQLPQKEQVFVKGYLSFSRNGGSAQKDAERREQGSQACKDQEQAGDPVKAAVGIFSENNGAGKK